MRHKTVEKLLLRKDGQVAGGTCPLFGMDRNMFGYL